MGCCASRVKDKRNRSFEAEESQDLDSENPMKIMQVINTPKRQKFFKKPEKTLAPPSISCGKNETLDLEEKEITNEIL